MSKTKTTAQAGKLYPWDKWLKLGTHHFIQRHRDYKCTTRTMITHVYARARRFGVRIKVEEVAPDRLRIQAHKGVN